MQTTAKMPFRRRNRQRVKLREGFRLRVFPRCGKQKARLTAVQRPELSMNCAPMAFQSSGGNAEFSRNDLVSLAITGSQQDFLLPL
jgi:hypothetical protein